MAKVEDALPYVLANEGGSKYTNNPKDPGGPTKWGITQRALASWRHHPVTPTDVQNLSLQEATLIYKSHYWDILSLDGVHSQRVATCIFDVCVNRGPGVARQYTSMTCARLHEPNVNACDEREFVKTFEAITEDGYRAIVRSKPGRIWALKGWLNRAKRMLRL